MHTSTNSALRGRDKMILSCRSVTQAEKAHMGSSEDPVSKNKIENDKERYCCQPLSVGLWVLHACTWICMHTCVVPCSASLLAMSGCHWYTGSAGSGQNLGWESTQSLQDGKTYIFRLSDVAVCQTKESESEPGWIDSIGLQSNPGMLGMWECYSSYKRNKEVWAVSLRQVIQSCSCSSNGDSISQHSDVSLCGQQEPGQASRSKIQQWVLQAREPSSKPLWDAPQWNNLCTLFHVDSDSMNLGQWDGIWRVNAFYWLRFWAGTDEAAPLLWTRISEIPRIWVCSTSPVLMTVWWHAHMPYTPIYIHTRTCTHTEHTHKNPSPLWSLFNMTLLTPCHTTWPQMWMFWTSEHCASLWAEWRFPLTDWHSLMIFPH
jgi:hypothetical protein